MVKNEDDELSRSFEGINSEIWGNLKVGFQRDFKVVYDFYNMHVPC